ncbi:MAG: hypothetical protein AAGI68_12405 [Planctomycetota bacterium]
MVSPKRNVQTVEAFQADAMATIRRLQEADCVEELTQDGEVKAVLLSPQRYQKLLASLEHAEDIAAIKKNLEDSDAGRVRDGFEALEEIKQAIRNRYPV